MLDETAHHEGLRSQQGTEASTLLCEELIHRLVIQPTIDLIHGDTDLIEVELSRAEELPVP